MSQTFDIFTHKTPNPRWGGGYIFVLLFSAVHDISRTFAFLTPLNSHWGGKSIFFIDFLGSSWNFWHFDRQPPGLPFRRWSLLGLYNKQWTQSSSVLCRLDASPGCFRPDQGRDHRSVRVWPFSIYCARCTQVQSARQAWRWLPVSGSWPSSVSICAVLL